MAWSANAVFISFGIVFTCACLLSLLCTYNFHRFREIFDYKNDIYYSQIAYHLSGLGCLWYKLWLTRVHMSHTVIMLASMFFYLYGLKHDFHHDKYFVQRNYGGVFCAGLLLLQVATGILSFFSATLKSTKLMSLVFGIHAYGGAWAYIISAYYNSLVYCTVRHEANEYKYLLRLLKAHEYSLLFMICTTYLLLNPYYDWRRMKAYSIGGVKTKSPFIKQAKN